MTMRCVLALCGILGLACMASPAAAECNDEPYYCWLRAHHAIAHMENRIAYLEADPNADDAYRGPIIDKLHRKALRLRTAIGPRWPHWPTPCCYSRRPIVIR
jgi:hypothetical protein